MKSLLLALMVAIVSISLAPTNAEARRLGGGGFAGMQRSLPARTPPAALPARPAPAATPAATPATPGAAATAAAAAPRRSWMGPIAGLAAGLGIAALMSHLGMGAEFGNLLMIVLLGVIAIVAIRFLMRRFGPASATSSPAVGAAGGMQFAGPGGAAWSNPTGNAAPTTPGAVPLASSASSAGAASALAAQPNSATAVNSAISTPSADFDAAGFERIAKMIFIRMQAANDSADLNDLRAFTTPEMYASIKLDLQDRGDKLQQTDVVKIDAEVLDVATEGERQIVSVRFHGLIREDKGGVAEPFDEVWHLVKPLDGSHEWAIAGIQQMA